MNRRRLLKLADLLEADAKNKNGIKFDLGTWGASSEINEPVGVRCGTTACAMGLATISGAFKRAGLVNRYGQFSWAIMPSMVGSGAEGLEAATELFDIDYDAANFLFIDDSYPRNKTEGAAAERFVAKRIRDFVAGKVSA